jgi:hypothetical protein
VPEPATQTFTSFHVPSASKLEIFELHFSRLSNNYITPEIPSSFLLFSSFGHGFFGVNGSYPKVHVDKKAPMD